MAQPPPAKKTKNPVKLATGWMRRRWHQPDLHKESRIHRTCRDFARHFRGLRVQLLVFYGLGGIGGIVGGLVASSGHLDALAVAEWAVVGLFVPPAVVCLLMFAWMHLRTPVAQRDEARRALLLLRRDVSDSNARIGDIEQARDEAVARAEAAERGAAQPQIGQLVEQQTVLQLPEDPGAAAEVIRQLGQHGPRYRSETATPEPRELRPSTPPDPQDADPEADAPADGAA